MPNWERIDTLIGESLDHLELDTFGHLDSRRRRRREAAEEVAEAKLLLSWGLPHARLAYYHLAEAKVWWFARNHVLRARVNGQPLDVCLSRFTVAVSQAEDELKRYEASANRRGFLRSCRLALRAAFRRQCNGALDRLRLMRAAFRHERDVAFGRFRLLHAMKTLGEAAANVGDFEIIVFDGISQVRDA